MQTIEGMLRAGEARGTLAAIGARQRGSALVYWAVLAVFAGGGALIGFGAGLLAERAFPNPPLDRYAAMFLGLWIGAIVNLVVSRSLITRVFRHRMQARGLSIDLPLSLSLDEEGVAYRCGEVTSVAGWAAVTEVFKVRGYWVFMVQMNPWFAPGRFFPDEAAERAFLRAALARMTPEARERSAQAVAFAGV